MSTTYQDLEEEARMKMDNEAQDLHGFLFHYNYFKKLWAKIPKERIDQYNAGEYGGVKFLASVNNLLGDELVVDRDEMTSLSQFCFDVSQLAKENGNDQELGKKIRQLTQEV